MFRLVFELTFYVECCKNLKIQEESFNVIQACFEEETHVALKITLKSAIDKFRK